MNSLDKEYVLIKQNNMKKYLILFLTIILFSCNDIENNIEKQSGKSGVVIGITSDVGGIGGMVSTNYYITFKVLDDNSRITKILFAKEASEYIVGDTVIIP